MRPLLAYITSLALTQALFAGPFYHQHERIQHEHDREALHGHAAVVHMHLAGTSDIRGNPEPSLPALDHAGHQSEPAPQHLFRRQPNPLAIVTALAPDASAPLAPSSSSPLLDQPGPQTPGSASRSAPRAPPV